MRVVVSDIHIGHPDQMHLKYFDHFMEDFMDCDEFIIVGDLFELWSSTPDIILKEKSTIKLLQKLDQTNKLRYILGNHDMRFEFMFRDHMYLNHTYPKYKFTINNKTFVATHGHNQSLESHFKGYRLLSFLLNIGLFSKLFYMFFSKPQYQWIENLYKKISSNVTHETSQTLEEAASNMKEDFVIMGHCHQLILKDKYANCGSWLESMDYLLIDDDGKITKHLYNGRR